MITARIQRLLRELVASPHTRFPVTGQGDDVVGILAAPRRQTGAGTTTADAQEPLSRTRNPVAGPKSCSRPRAARS